jgi:uncharacterized protein (DUF433 family)
MQTSWFPDLMRQFEIELDALHADRQDMRPSLEKEKAQLEEQVQGWSMSLAKPNLNSALRARLEKEVDAAILRQEEIDRQLLEADALRRHARAVVDPEQVVDRLNRLADVLAGQNPTRTNLELALHIDNIRCFQDGRVIVRTCKLGALAGGKELFANKEKNNKTIDIDSSASAAIPRRRPIRRVSDSGDDCARLQAAAHEAAEVNRFGGLGEEWFWQDEFAVPEPTCWSREHAEEVAELRQTGMTHEQLAKHFQVSVPTVRSALEHWRAKHPDAAAMPRKMPRPRWEVENAQEVSRLRTLGYKLKDLANHFGLCQETIRKAIRIAEQQEATQEATPHQSKKDSS